MSRRHVLATRPEPPDVLQCPLTLPLGHGELCIHRLSHDLCDRDASSGSYLAELFQLLGGELNLDPFHDVMIAHL